MPSSQYRSSFPFLVSSSLLFLHSFSEDNAFIINGRINRIKIMFTKNGMKREKIVCMA